VPGGSARGGAAADFVHRTIRFRKRVTKNRLTDPSEICGLELPIPNLLGFSDYRHQLIDFSASVGAGRRPSHSVALSVKSIGLNAPWYGNPANLSRQIDRHVNQLQAFDALSSEMGRCANRKGRRGRKGIGHRRTREQQHPGSATGDHGSD
jgi:hypothetical protein